MKIKYSGLIFIWLFSSNVFGGLFSGVEDLLKAIDAKDIDGVKEYIEYVNTMNETVLWDEVWGAGKGSYPITVATDRKEDDKTVEIVKILLENGANPNQRAGCLGLSEDGCVSDTSTPIERTIERRNVRTLELLVSFGATLDVDNRFSALDDFFFKLNYNNKAYIEKNDVVFIERLIELGADIFFVNSSYSKFYSSPLCDMVDFITNIRYEQLREDDGYIEKTFSMILRDDRMLKYLESDKHCAGKDEPYGAKEPLYAALYLGMSDYLDRFYRKGIDLDRTNRQGLTPLLAAILRNDIPTMSWLINKGVDVDNATKLNGFINKALYHSHALTPLHMASLLNNKNAAELLISHGADKSITSSDGKAAAALAMKEGNVEVYHFLTGSNTLIKNVDVTAAVDKKPPVIVILSPESQRALQKARTFEKTLTVVGKVTDESRIKSAELNGKPLYLDSDGNFEHIVSLKKGQNKFVVSATDKFGNTSSKTMLLSVDKFSSSNMRSMLNWYKNQYALIVGVDEYYNAEIPTLKNAVNDAKKIADILARQGYRVSTLFNDRATKKNILKAFQEIRKKTGSDDSFLFYFAGHGQGLSIQNSEKVGYLLPFDADIALNSEDIFEYDEVAISLSQIRQYAQAMKSNHVALLLDSCFSGLVMKRSLPKTIKRNTQYYNDILSRKAINILTAGDDQPVSDGTDHSPFTTALIEGLENKGVDVGDGDGLSTFNELATYVKSKVEKSTNRRQRPQFDNLSTEDGDLIFSLEVL